jgi:hypothetical protein
LLLSVSFVPVQALHQHTLKLLSQALGLFPHISVKLSAFLERLLQVRGKHVVATCFSMFVCQELLAH